MQRSTPIYFPKPPKNLVFWSVVFGFVENPEDVDAGALYEYGEDDPRLPAVPLAAAHNFPLIRLFQNHVKK